jgi:hypothetical protein
MIGVPLIQGNAIFKTENKILKFIQIYPQKNVKLEIWS